MEHLTGINIRTGIEELNIPVSEIFKINLDPCGDKRIKELHSNGTIKTLNKYPELKIELEEDKIGFFSDKKTSHNINETLTAFIYDSYLAHKNDFGKIICKRYIDIQFVNTEILDLEMFCQNVMAAQSFAGNYDVPEYLYSFIGLGNFTFQEYSPLHPLVMNSHCNFMHFFVYFHKIISGIYHLSSARYLVDLELQKHYLSDKEYKALKRLYKKQRTMFDAAIQDWDGPFSFGESDGSTDDL